MNQTRYQFSQADCHKGGQTTAERYGAAHMRHLGQMGHLSTCERHYSGDAQAMMRDLRARMQQRAVWSGALQCWVRQVPPRPLS